MKKFKFLIFLFFLCIQTLLLNAQDSIAKEKYSFKNTTVFGIKTGLDQTFVYNADRSFDRINFFAGLFADTKLSERTSIQYELRYSNYRTHHFIETPLLFKYRLNDKISLFVGPRFDFFLNDNNVAKNYSLSAEFGVQYNLSKKLFLEASISSSFENQVVIDDFNAGSRSNLRIGIGYKF